jgi:O-antigen ligase
MGFALTVVYIVLTIISPEQFGPEWENYHVLQYLALATLFASLPVVWSNWNLKPSIQTLLLVAFVIAIALSQVANGWFGGVVDSCAAFLPTAAAFFFLVANITTSRRLKIATWVIVGATLFVVVEALCGYYAGFRGDMFILRNNLYEGERVVGSFLRLCGTGFMRDPNDFAHMLAIALPLVLIGWKPRQLLSNFLCVLIPFVLLLWAIYLTHSRGALLGLVAISLFAGHRKLGTIASSVLAGLLAIGMMALDFTGGRAISASEGADRLEAWSTGLELFKGAPVFGIGFHNFTDYNEITAHNSFVLCLAELGLIGSTIWVALLVTTVMNLNDAIAAGGQVRPADDLIEKESEAPSFFTLWYPAPVGRSVARKDPQPANSTNERLSEDLGDMQQNVSVAIASLDSSLPIPSEINASIEIETKSEQFRDSFVPQHWFVAIRLALVSFLVTSWFLSRTYQTPLYLVLGLAASAVALPRTDTQARGSRRWMLVTLGVEAVAVMFIYGVVRFRR